MLWYCSVNNEEQKMMSRRQPRAEPAKRLEARTSAAKELIDTAGRVPLQGRAQCENKVLRLRHHLCTASFLLGVRLRAAGGE